MFQVSCNDEKTEVALALSKSLHEFQQNEQLDEIQALAEAAGEPIIITSEEERRTVLQNFGFTSNESVVKTKVKTKKGD